MRKEVRAVSDGKSPAEIPHMRIGESDATTTRSRHSVNSMLLIASMVVSMALVGCMSLEERLASSDAKIKKDAEIELYQIAVATRNDAEVVKAINRITSNEVLARIAAHSEENIARKAVERMNEDQWLCGVATMSNFPSVQGKAVERMNEDQWLYRVATMSKFPSVQESAASKIKSEERLFDLYNDPDASLIREIVIKRMDSGMLARIPYNKNLSLAWRNIEDEKILARMFKDSIGVLSAVEQKELAMKLVAKGFPRDSLFLYRLNDAEVTELRRKSSALDAKRNFDHEELFIFNSKLREILCAAVCEKMSDEDIVKGIVGYFKVIKDHNYHNNNENKTKDLMAFARLANGLKLKTAEARQALCAE